MSCFIRAALAEKNGQNSGQKQLTAAAIRCTLPSRPALGRYEAMCYMPRRFPTEPLRLVPAPAAPPPDDTGAPTNAIDENTHRYFRSALADIKNQIALARGEPVQDSPQAEVTATTAETTATSPHQSSIFTAENMHPWSPNLPSMSAGSAGEGTEVTQRYAHREAGIRAAIAAAREGGDAQPAARARGRGGLDAAAHVKVPSLILFSEDVAEKPDDEPEPNA